MRVKPKHTEIVDGVIYRAGDKLPPKKLSQNEDKPKTTLKGGKKHGKSVFTES